MADTCSCAVELLGGIHSIRTQDVEAIRIQSRTYGFRTWMHIFAIIAMCIGEADFPMDAGLGASQNTLQIEFRKELREHLLQHAAIPLHEDVGAVHRKIPGQEVIHRIQKTYWFA